MTLGLTGSSDSEDEVMSGEELDEDDEVVSVSAFLTFSGFPSLITFLTRPASATSFLALLFFEGFCSSSC